MKRAPTPHLTADQKQRLSSWANSRLVQVRLAERARIVLLAAEGFSDKDVAAREGCDRRTVALWRRRFIENGLAGIEQDAPRRAAKRRIPLEKIDTVIHLTKSEAPPNGMRWSSRAMAQVVGMSEASIRRIWQTHGIVPSASSPKHRPDTKGVPRWRAARRSAPMPPPQGISADVSRETTRA